ncbi:MAG: TetR/AcrR family transcriptional regulator [Acidimicrobiales bacterium]|nr:TetR/AcrR family transcriptional regulator [Acidimicrobiales bacterium]
MTVGETAAEQARDQGSTREAILLAARRAFAERGYDGASIGEIASAVGIAKASVLHHFPNKDELYTAVFERLLAEWFLKVENAIEGPYDGWDQFDRGLSAGFEFFAENPDIVRLVRREALDGTHFGVDLGATLRPMFERAVGFLQAQIKDGVFRDHDPEQMVISGLGAVLSYFSDVPFIEGLLGEDPRSDELVARRRDHIREFFRVALQKEP